MRLAMTGGGGRVGKLLAPYGVLDLKCDVTNLTDCLDAFNRVRPDLIVHLASKSDVEWCQDAKNEQDAFNVNVRGVLNTLQAAERYKCQVILLSSDHIFDGRRWFGKYKEDDSPLAVNFYGQTKMAAESMSKMFSNVKVVRTSYLFDYPRMEKELVRMMSSEPIQYPSFIKRSFLYAPHFARLLWSYISRYDAMPKVLHLSGSEIVSWYDFAIGLASTYGLATNHLQARKKSVNGYAPRGNNLGLDVSLSRRLGFPQLTYLDGFREMKADNG